MSELIDAIKQSAQQPKSATIDGQTFIAHPLQDQIAADKYAKACDVQAKGSIGIRVVRTVQPGAM